MRAFTVAAIGLALLLSAATARAAGYAAELKVSDGTISKSSTSKPPAPADHRPRRPTFEASADAKFTATWKVVRTNPGEAKDVLIHFVVVKLDRPGQAIPSLEPARVPIECALTMDFPKDKSASGSQQFHLDSPGVYLVRIEAGADPDKPGQEDLAELEVVVK
jgi:hypothetical protein